MNIESIEDGEEIEKEMDHYDDLDCIRFSIKAL